MTAVTENGAPAHASTQDARLDLFFKTVRDLVPVPPVEGKPGERTENLEQLLDASWTQDPLDTMKILFNWRDCRGGKADRHGFIIAMQLVSQKHPEWFKKNAEHIPYFGRHLDLVHLWYLVECKSFVMELLVNQLKRDKQLLGTDKAHEISLVAKWIPSENAKWDRFIQGHPRFCVSLCKELFGTRYAVKQHLSRLRKEYLAPLRKHIDIVESRMCSKQFDTIEYSKVPSVAMNRYRNAFRNRDGDRFQEYMSKVEAGTVKINAKQVLPHDLVRHYLHNGTTDPVIEAQWQVLQKAVDESSAFENAICICDVSGSMSGTPMEVCIALGLLSVNQSNNHQVMTFSENPQLFTVMTQSLQERVHALSGMQWGMSTNMTAAFNLLLKKLPDVQRVFIFSDMQFNQACNNTHFDALKNRYEKIGREMPQIVFWNLRGGTNNFPVKQDQEGVLLLSGYSPALLTAVMDGKDITPLAALQNIIYNPRYDLIQAP